MTIAVNRHSFCLTITPCFSPTRRRWTPFLMTRWRKQTKSTGMINLSKQNNCGKKNHERRQFSFQIFVSCHNRSHLRIIVFCTLASKTCIHWEGLVTLGLLPGRIGEGSLGTLEVNRWGIHSWTYPWLGFGLSSGSPSGSSSGLHGKAGS